MVRAMSGVQLKNIKRGEGWIVMLSLNDTIDQCALVCLCLEEGG